MAERCSVCGSPGGLHALECSKLDSSIPPPPPDPEGRPSLEPSFPIPPPPKLEWVKAPTDEDKVGSCLAEAWVGVAEVASSAFSLSAAIGALLSPSEAAALAKVRKASIDLSQLVLELVNATERARKGRRSPS